MTDLPTDPIGHDEPGRGIVPSGPAADASAGGSYGWIPSTQEEVLASALAALLGQVRAGLDAVQRVSEEHPEVHEALRAVRDSASRLGRGAVDGAAGSDAPDGS